MFCGAPGADYPDNFIAPAVAIGVGDHKQCQATDDTKRLPALFAIGHSLENNDMKWIIPNFLSEGE